ncbi:hypothetical protein [Peribacillus loiseleuriae]|nr:hypothetical protein [Peribacillus loiseleuriae]
MLIVDTKRELNPIKDLPRDRLFFLEDIMQRKSDMDKKRGASS